MKQLCLDCMVPIRNEKACLPDAALCSHVTAVCYMAESINTETARVAEACSNRRCPGGSRRRPGAYFGIGGPVIMGQHTPDRYEEY
jgi:hypothetical protein